MSPKPDYAKIARLERELGLADPEPPPRPIRALPTVCLTKDCDGDTEEFWTWQGTLATRFHHCRRPA